MRTYFIPLFAFFGTLLLTGVAFAGGSEVTGPVFVTGPAREPHPDAVTPARLLAERLGPVRASGSTTATDAETLPRATDFALASSAARQYGDVRISVYQTADESTAWAAIASIRPGETALTELGDEGWESASATAFRFAEYAAVIEGGNPATRLAAAKALVQTIGPRRAPAPLARFLPEGERIAGSERYAASFEAVRRWRPDLVEDVFQFEAGGADAMVADYRQPDGTNVRILLVDYQTPQLAWAAHRRIEAFYETLTAEAKQHRFFKREGNFLIEATGVSDETYSRALVDTVKYDFSIKMLKDDRAAALRFAEETRKAAMLFVNSFTFVGLALLGALTVGLAVGAIVFRRRRRAAANVFSDAGGMVHLDLGPAGHLPRSSAIGLLPSSSAEN